MNLHGPAAMPSIPLPLPHPVPSLPVRALGVGGIDWTGFDPSVLDRSFFVFSLLDLLVFNCAGFSCSGSSKTGEACSGLSKTGFSRSGFSGFGSGGLGCSRMVYSMAPSWPLGLRPCIAARPPMRERIWAASFAPPTGEKKGDFPPVFIQFCVPPAGHKKTPQVCVTHGVAPADGRSVFSYMVTGRRPRLTGAVPISRHFVVFQRVKAHSTVVKS